VVPGWTADQLATAMRARGNSGSARHRPTGGRRGTRRPRLADRVPPDGEIYTIEVDRCGAALLRNDRPEEEIAETCVIAPTASWAGVFAHAMRGLCMQDAESLLSDADERRLLGGPDGSTLFLRHGQGSSKPPAEATFNSGPSGLEVRPEHES